MTVLALAVGLSAFQIVGAPRGFALDSDKALVFISSAAGLPIIPAAMAAANDGFIIVGSEGLDGWAVKANQDGESVWSYRLPLPKPSRRGSVAMISCAAPMADGSVFLGANVPTATGDHSSLLVHLDSKGALLDEHSLGEAAQSTMTEIKHCITWEDSVVVLGIVRDFHEPTTPRAFHLVALIDIHGNTKWKTQVPVDNNFSAFDVAPPLITQDANFIFSATDNVNSEILSIDHSGRLLARRKVPGSFQVVRPSRQDAIRQIWGKYQNSYSLITLNAGLDEVVRLPSPFSEGFLTRLAFRTADQKIVLLGSNVHGAGETYSSGVVSIDFRLQKSWQIPVPLSDPIADRGSIWAAAPTGDGFAIARSFAAGNINTASLPPGFRFGAVINFIQIR